MGVDRLMLEDFERADRIGEFWGYTESRAFAELLIDCEEDRALRAVLVDVHWVSGLGIGSVTGLTENPRRMASRRTGDENTRLRDASPTRRACRRRSEGRKEGSSDRTASG
jgi:hypothetical protein